MQPTFCHIISLRLIALTVRINYNTIISEKTLNPSRITAPINSKIQPAYSSILYFFTPRQPFITAASRNITGNINIYFLTSIIRIIPDTRINMHKIKLMVSINLPRCRHVFRLKEFFAIMSPRFMLPCLKLS